jgi:hypothetical protein
LFLIYDSVFRFSTTLPHTILGYFFADSNEAPPSKIDSLPGVGKGLVTNVIKSGVHGSFRESLAVSGSTASNWTIQIEKPDFLSTLYYKQTPPPSAKFCEGEIAVSYVGLNFKDVMLSSSTSKAKQDSRDSFKKSFGKRKTCLGGMLK